MEFYPANANSIHDGRHSRRRRGAALAVLVVIGLAASGLLFGPRLFAAFKERSYASQARERALAAWESGDRAATLAVCEEGLERRPLDPVLLSLAGFSAFYRGASEPDAEARLADMDRAISYLRLSLVAPESPYRPQALYVLGKAYFRKGPAWYAEAIESLLVAAEAGQLGDDTWEHVALAYVGLGENERAGDYFDKALEARRNDTLLLAAARARLSLAQSAEAEALVVEALAASEDAFVRELCRFLYGDILEAKGSLSEAEAQYRAVLDENQNSAEAHFRLGLLAQKSGDTALARAEWRKAVSLDPVHAAARLKLAERP